MRRAVSDICISGVLAPTTDALAGALFGERDFSGHLPVALGELYPRGHGLRLGQPVSN